MSVSAWGRIEEMIGVDAGDRAPNHGVDQVDRRPDEPDQHAAPRQRLPLSAKQKPVGNVEKRNKIVKEDIGYLFEPLGVPDVPEKQWVSEADDGDINRSGCFEVGTGVIGVEGYPSAHAGYEEIAKNGEEAAVTDDDRCEVETFGESVRDGEIEAEGKG
jgi:hypothetical protein